MEKHTIGVAVVSTARLTTLKKFFRLMLFASFKAAVRPSVTARSRRRTARRFKHAGSKGRRAAADRHSADGREEAPASPPWRGAFSLWLHVLP